MRWLRTAAAGALGVGRANSLYAVDIICRLVLGGPRIMATPPMALEQWVNVTRNENVPRKGRVLIAAMRNQRWVEWAVFSCCMAVKHGYRPVFAYSSEEMSEVYGLWESIKRASYGFLPRFLEETWVEKINIDRFVSIERDSDCDGGVDFCASSHIATAYDLRVEEHESDKRGRYESHRQAMELRLRRYFLAWRSVLEEVRPTRVVAPSGLISHSSALREAARHVGVPVVFVEGWAMRPGHNIVGVNRPALDFDISTWLADFGPWNDRHESDYQDFARFRRGERVRRPGWLDDFHQVQRSEELAALPRDLRAFLRADGPLVLLGTNVVGDSATLGKATIFKNQREWIGAVVDFFRVRADWRLIIRAHPDEKWARAPVRLGTIARDAARGVKNVFVVSGRAAVNTFALMKMADVGLAWVSNFGLDMALLGKPVILAARAPYACTGVCTTAPSRDEYFAEINRAVANPVGPTNTELEHAKKYQLILFDRMSFLSDSPRYRGSDYRMDDQAMASEIRRFYGILFGEVTPTVRGNSQERA
jgi:hypothetical protein